MPRKPPPRAARPAAKKPTRKPGANGKPNGKKPAAKKPAAGRKAPPRRTTPPSRGLVADELVALREELAEARTELARIASAEIHIRRTLESEVGSALSREARLLSELEALRLELRTALADLEISRAAEKRAAERADAAQREVKQIRQVGRMAERAGDHALEQLHALQAEAARLRGEIEALQRAVAPGPHGTLGLRHVALSVADVAAAEAFYTSVLGFEVEWRPDDDNVYLRLHGDNLALHRFVPADEAEAEAFRAGRAQRLGHIGIVVKSPDDVDAWADRLAERGVPLLRAPRTHRDGARSLYFADPDGVEIQILYHPPISEPAATS